MRNIKYLSETHLKLKSRKISFVHNIRVNNLIIFKFGTEYGSIIAVRCVKY